MLEFQYRRQPTIENYDLEEINKLLKIFDKLCFNLDGEFIYQIDYNFPIIGKLTISYYAKETHLKVWRTDDEHQKSILSGYFEVDNKTQNDIVDFVHKEIVEKLKLISYTLKVEEIS